MRKMAFLHRCFAVCSHFPKKTVRDLILSSQQQANYTRSSQLKCRELPSTIEPSVSEGVDYKGNVTWLQYLVDRNAENFLANLSDKQLKDKDNLDLWIDCLRTEGHSLIPEKITAQDWKILLRDKRTHQEKLLYLGLVYRRQENYRLRAEREQESIRLIKQPFDDDDLNLMQNTIRMRKHLNQWNGIASLKFGRPLIIDMDYKVNDHEAFLTYQQIETLYKYNCEHMQPCKLVFTSALTNELMKDMVKMGRNMMADFYAESLLEVFPRKNLFYLVPEGPEISDDQFTEDTVVILGGIGGTFYRRRSFTKAIKLGIPYGSLPLDSFVRLKRRSTKDIYLPAVVGILLDKFVGFSWKQALEAHLPDAKYEKYPDWEGPLPDKHDLSLKSHVQFNVLSNMLKKHNIGK